MAAELRRTHEEQVAGRNQDAFEALQWFEGQSVYAEMRAVEKGGKRLQGYIARDDEADDGTYEAVVEHPDRSRDVVRGLSLLGAIESLKDRLERAS